MENPTNPSSSLLDLFLSLHHHLQKIRRKKSFFALLSLLLLLLSAYNVLSIFCIDVPFSAITPPEPASFSPESVAGKSQKWQSSSPTKLSSSLKNLILEVKEENPPLIPKTHLPLLQKSQNLVLSMADSSIHMPKRRRRRRRRPIFRILKSIAKTEQFSTRVKQFFSYSISNSSCQVRFFMTWISSVDSFGDRELFAIQSLFKSHPNGCLIIVSNTMDSKKGIQILSPFQEKGFRISAISPDFDYLFKNTVAETWFRRLKKGNVDPGEVSLGQNLSNLLRLALLYKFGGVYIDTDIVILKSFSKLRNSIGAQTIDLKTKNWSRLNNAVMIFDKGHPLLYKFIEEFALTFDGNKWGHNGPYLVSRVVSRVRERAEFEFSVLPPMAFYPVDWMRIQSLFQGPINESHSKWIRLKLKQIRSQSFAIHLWNRQSREVKVEEGSVFGHVMLDCCVFCNSSFGNRVETVLES